MRWSKLLVLAVSTGLAAKAARWVAGRAGIGGQRPRGRGHSVQRWEGEGGSPVTPALPAAPGTAPAVPKGRGASGQTPAAKTRAVDAVD